ncbi:VOC family protein [Kribbella qitaiheensis]|uniref:VOC family protein n=1 Tax=Kribbella qitaiheensis TaxID=1544730 RepID=A0A7G6X0E3_9ACTN|nr:VOC family protein [Kribbella qitaiheensis]QNE19708.1 VOC family protein [Kribbella qitaiheensis]
MVERNTPWPPGTPNWVDLAADDPAAAAEFYVGLFGWNCQHRSSSDYFVCGLDGEDVGGIGPKQPGMEQLPSRWTTYLATDQVEHTLDVVRAEGGRELVAPQDIAVQGRMAIAADPNGAIFGLWQAAEHIGSERRSTPGSLVWSEALSRDHATARKFYMAVFGYRSEEVGGYDTQYAALYAADRPVAGTGELHPDMPPDTPPHWLPYFATAAVDTTVAQIVAGGGALIGSRLDTDFGRMAVLADPEGARFAVIQLG